jgi:hypothetical protein
MKKYIENYFIEYNGITHYFMIDSYISSSFFLNLTDEKEIMEMLILEEGGIYEIINTNYHEIIYKIKREVFSKTQIKKCKKTEIEYNHFNLDYSQKLKFIEIFSQQYYSQLKRQKRISLYKALKISHNFDIPYTNIFLNLDE